MDEAVHMLEGEVRELIRIRGIDPLQDAALARALINEAISDYETRSQRGAVPHVPDLVSTAKSLADLVIGFGPLQPYLEDPGIEEIWINEPGLVFVARGGVAELTTTLLTDTQVRDLVERMLRSSGRRLDLSSPFVDASLPGGERLHVVIPDVTRRHWAVNIRKYVARARTTADLVALDSLTPAAAEFLDAAVASGLNILVSGATQAGKTTMVNALAGAIPAAEHIITCEEVFELNLAARDVVAMQCRSANLEGTGEIPLRRLVKEALRMRPNRIIIGEVREAEAFDLLIALNSGIPGMATIHANSAREAITKIASLPLLAGQNINSSFTIPAAAGAVDLVVHVDLNAAGRRRTREILAVTGTVEKDTIAMEPVFHRERDDLVRAKGFPPHQERFERAGFDVANLLGGKGLGSPGPGRGREWEP